MLNPEPGIYVNKWLFERQVSLERRRSPSPRPWGVHSTWDYRPAALPRGSSALCKEGDISDLEIRFRDLGYLWATKGPWVTRRTRRGRKRSQRRLGPDGA